MKIFEQNMTISYHITSNYSYLYANYLFVDLPMENILFWSHFPSTCFNSLSSSFSKCWSGIRSYQTNLASFRSDTE